MKKVVKGYIRHATSGITKKQNKRACVYLPIFIKRNTRKINQRARSRGEEQHRQDTEGYDTYLSVRLWDAC